MSDVLDLEQELRELVGAGEEPVAELLQARLSFSTKSDPPACQDGGNLCNFGYAGAGSLE